MSQHHKQEFFSQLRRQGWQVQKLLSCLPSLDANKVGEEVDWATWHQRFQSKEETYFHAFFQIRYGELLLLDSQWIELWKHIPNESWARAGHLMRALWHVQYATNVRQQAAMLSAKCPGTQIQRGSHNINTESFLSEKQVLAFGSSSVCSFEKTSDDTKVRDWTIKMREGRVVTWPQLFIFGLHSGLTAMDIFCCGCHLELVLTKRQRSKPNEDTNDAALMRFSETGSWCKKGRETRPKHGLP